VTFQEFYSRYPKKVAKKDAEKAWARLSEEQKRAALEALPKHVRSWEVKGTAQEYVPHPASWINGERWEDEIELAEAIPQKAIAWWASDEGVMSKGRELGIHARSGEGMQQYKARVVEAARKAA
jgi:hypothetical protein